MAGVFISAGEASGDHYGAELIREMQARDGTLQFFGLSGPQMRAQGCEAVVDAESVAHMGITEVILHAPAIYRQFARLKASIAQRKPALAVLIDFPDVNFRLAKHCRRLNVPVVWLVSPQLWAWKKYRLRWVQQRVTRMLVIFPFEEKFYRDRNVDAEFIGHPLADLPLPVVSRDEFAQQHGLDLSRQWVAMLPGSRSREFDLNFPAMQSAAAILGPEYRYVVPIAPTLDYATFARRVAAAGMIPVADARAALFHARASVVASGTATVQAALMGNPFVIVYKMSSLSWFIARAVVTAPFAGMPNLIAGREIVPELLQNDFTPANVAATLQPLLEETLQRSTMLRDLAQLQQSLIRNDAALPNPATKAENKESSTAMARAASAAMALLYPNP